MGSLGGEVARGKKAMLVYPKMMGANPSERWGHSACYFNGLIYIFGGCRGGMHFSDVLVCNLTTMAWNVLKTSGPGPGPRDSHSAVLVGHKMLVFGGTNGSKKVNDLHILDLLSREWARPDCRGSPPSARESHTANVVGDEKLIVFGGSGEGEANYLNDLHVLDLKSMEWSSPEVRGSVPAPRDSHSSVVVGNRLFVFGGDSGDRYQGDVNVLDMNKMTWSRIDAHGPSPGARAGHAAVSIGTKIYVLGGVGDKQYYNDIWVLDAITPSWTQLDICSQKSQGRFSHTATMTNLGIAIFGGCGENEHPLNELLILQIGSPVCRAFGNTYKEETKMFLKNTQNNSKKAIIEGENDDLSEVEELPEQSFRFSSDMLHPKRRRTSNSKLLEGKLDHEPHSLSQSQQSSPSQSDHEQTPATKGINGSYPSSRVHPLFRQRVPVPINPKMAIPRTCPDIYSSSDHPNQMKQEHIRNVIYNDACRVQCNAAESLSVEAGKFKNMIGAEVRGQVDVAFDSGYLMTATVNGRVFRGVLFAPGPDLPTRGAIIAQHPLSFKHHDAVNHVSSGQSNGGVGYPRYYRQPTRMVQSSPERRSRLCVEREELQGVVLTLASPGSEHGGL